MRRRAGLTMIEALVSSLVILVALPVLVRTSMAIVRMDNARQERAQATDLARVALERMHYLLYNSDSSGYLPTDSIEARRARYATKSYLSTLTGFAEEERGVAARRAGSGSDFAPSREVSRYFASVYNVQTPQATNDTGVQVGLDETLSPVLAREVRNNVIKVDARAFLDDPVNAKDPLAVKTPEQPRSDLVRVSVKLDWRGPEQGTHARVFETAFTRPVFELDPEMSEGGR